jgi:hypothetical protein
MTSERFDYRYRFKRHRPELFGKRCRVLIYGRRLNQILIEMSDGERHVTVRHAVEPVGPEYREPAQQGRLF